MKPDGAMSPKAADWPHWIPVFPLPNAVLMPMSVLPLNVFEKRYRIMTRDALASHRMIAIALLETGFESKYDTLEAPIHPVVCVGRILREERLEDGRYNFLLQGLNRAQIVEENRELSYRRAHLRVLHPQPLQPEVERTYRSELLRMLSEEPLVQLARRGGWMELFRCHDLAFSDLVDVLAATVLRCCEDKQQFLSEPRVFERVRCLCDLLEELSMELRELRERPARVRAWPPVLSEN
ncbi:MAG TPA: LON peptidase substrate-binding domain-containing protein [Phycisphaerae bacterium]|nr:LON peptidase substrate-binding domain-containing protein [Phycisphaerae bacterium]